MADFENQTNNNNNSENYSNANIIEEKDETKGPPQACIFVASLANDVTEQKLQEIFGKFGTILKIKLLKDRTSKPYAFVQFLNVENAEEALEQTQGQVFDGRKIRVERAKVNRTLFLAKFNKSLQANQLREIVECYGTIENVTIIKNHQTNKSKGCGFVKFLYREDAMEAFLNLKTKQRRWVVEWATSNNDPEVLGVDKYNIFIGGLNPTQVDKQILQDRFSQYGEIESITLINRAESENPENQTNQNVGAPEDFENPNSQKSAFAFIRFKDQAHSASAIESENGVEWLDRRIRVQYCESQEMKNKRRANKYLKYQYNYYNGLQMMYMGGMLPYYPINSNNIHHKFNPYAAIPYENAPIDATELSANPYSYPIYYNPSWLGYQQDQGYLPIPYDPNDQENLDQSFSHLSLGSPVAWGVQ